MAKLFLEGPQEVMSVLKRIAVVWKSSSVGENELQKCIVDECALYDMTK